MVSWCFEIKIFPKYRLGLQQIRHWRRSTKTDEAAFYFIKNIRLFWAILASKTEAFENSFNYNKNYKQSWTEAIHEIPKRLAFIIFFSSDTLLESPNMFG